MESLDLENKWITQSDKEKRWLKLYPIRKWNAFIVLDDMIANIINIKKLNQVVTELFITGQKLNIFTVFIT